MTRAEKVAMAQKLRTEGLVLREIAARMGVALSTASAYLTDPHLSKLRARKASYAKPCDWCGGPTDGSGGFKTQRTICNACQKWPDEAIIDAIRRWADEHGGIPPRADDWSRTPHPGYPSATTVIIRFGWNEALLRAGYALHNDKRPETQKWVEQQLRAGVPTAELADALGVTPEAISQRLRYRGTTIRALRREAA